MSEAKEVICRSQSTIFYQCTVSPRAAGSNKHAYYLLTILSACYQQLFPPLGRSYRWLPVLGVLRALRLLLHQDVNIFQQTMQSTIWNSARLLVCLLLTPRRAKKWFSIWRVKNERQWLKGKAAEKRKTITEYMQQQLHAINFPINWKTKKNTA